LGLLLSVVVHPASVQERDGAGDLLRVARRSFPFIERIFADAGYQGRMARVTSADSFIPLGDAAAHVLVSEPEIEQAARRLLG